MSKQWPPVAAVTAGVFVWLSSWGIIDLLVLQVYPLPSGLWGSASIRDIVATRPNAAVALNLAGELLVLSVVAFMASRWAKGRTARAGVWVTGLVVLLAVGNALATANFRWVHVVGLPLFLLCGVVAANRGARAVG